MEMSFGVYLYESLWHEYVAFFEVKSKISLLALIVRIHTRIDWYRKLKVAHKPFNIIGYNTKNAICLAAPQTVGQA